MIPGSGFRGLSGSVCRMPMRIARDEKEGRKKGCNQAQAGRQSGGQGRRANETSSLPLLGFFLFAPPSLLPSPAILPP